MDSATPPRNADQRLSRRHPLSSRVATVWPRQTTVPLRGRKPGCAPLRLGQLHSRHRSVEAGDPNPARRIGVSRHFD